MWDIYLIISAQTFALDKNMKFKIFLLLFLLGFGILLFLLFLVNHINEKANDARQAFDKYFSKRDQPPPRIPRTDEIPIEIRQKFASAPVKPKLIAEFSHGDYLEKVIFSPTNPDLIVSMNSKYKAEKNIKLWNINNPTNPIAEFGGDAVSISSNGEILAISDMGNFDEPVKLWSIVEKKFVSSFRASGFNVTFSPNGKHLSLEKSGLEFWDVSNPAKPVEAFKLKSEKWQEDHTFSVDGTLLATIESIEDIVNIWEITGNQAYKKNSFDAIHRKVGWIEAMQFLPNPKNPILAIADNDYGIKLYHPPNWKDYTTISAENVNDLAFTADGDTIISVGISKIEFWSVKKGNRYASIEGFSRWTECVDVSADSRYVAGGGNDGIIRVWDITNFLPSVQNHTPNVVVPIYFLSTNRMPQTDVTEKIDNILREAQTYFADEMERNGYERKSFEYEKNEDGTAKIYLLEGISDDKYYRKYTDSRVMKEIEQHFGTENNIFFVVVDIGNEKTPTSDEVKKEIQKIIQDFENIDAHLKRLRMEARNIVYRKQEGAITIRESSNEYSIDTIVSKFVELFGLTLDYRHPSYLMSYEKKSKQLSKSSTEWLNKCQYFNSVETYFDDKTKVKKLSPTIGKARFRVEDADGIYQVRLLVAPTKKYTPKYYNKKTNASKNTTDGKDGFRRRAYGLHDVMTLNGKKKTTVKFDYPNHVDNMIELHVIDELGNRVYVNIDISGNPVASVLRSIFN